MSNSITALQKHVGTYIWTELAIASALSHFIDTTKEISAVALAGSHAQSHGELARLWHERMPTLWDHEHSNFVAAPSDATAQSVTNLNNTTVDSPTSEKLIALYNGLMADLLHSYSAHLAKVDRRTDPATHSVLSQCITVLTQHIDDAQSVISALNK